MILILDTLRDNQNITRCIGAVFYDAIDEHPVRVLSSEVELPVSFNGKMGAVASAVKLIKSHNLKPETIIIKGLVHQSDRTDDFGMALYKALGDYYGNLSKKLKIVGIKLDQQDINTKPFGTMHKAYRNSIRPVIVTTSTYDVGINQAVCLVKDMAGNSRVPSLISFITDQLEYTSNNPIRRIAA
ncbi:hypothetical protein LMH73_028375 [Vibrio splendidus]|nr:hypothetical protein [Vibrio splendidus]MCC4879459.1 hypothetical protein [Vibrio splendidus]